MSGFFLRSGRAFRIRRGGSNGRVLGLAMLVALVLAAALALLALVSSSFSEAVIAFFAGPFATAYNAGNMLNLASTLLLCGLGAAVAFSSHNFNLGGEGQLYAGALSAALVCLALPDRGAAIPVLAVLGGTLCGALIAGFSGWLKRAAAVDELVSSFLISSALVLVCDYLVGGPLQDAASNFQTTASISSGYRLAGLWPPSNLSWACLVSLALLLGMSLMMRLSRLGFELRLCGMNREFARYVGVDVGRRDIAAMSLSGALHGLAGALMILGTYHKVMKGFSAGMGWSGIAAALIAGGNPLAVLPASVFMAYLEAGSKALMIGSDSGPEIIYILQSLIFFLVTARGIGAARHHSNSEEKKSLMAKKKEKR